MEKLSLFVIGIVVMPLFSTPVVAAGSGPRGDKYSQERINTKINGIIALRGNQRHITRAYVTRVVYEAIDVLAKKENSWFPLHDLLGLAINESDLQWWVVTGRRDSKRYEPDCGIMQNHTPLFRKGRAARKSLCLKLGRSTKLSLEYGMEELNMIKDRWCTPRRVKSTNPNDTYRCILNVYNQGPRYILGNPVRNAYRNRYWLRSKCFSTGVLLGRKPLQDCRQARSLIWIRDNFRRTDNVSRNNSITSNGGLSFHR